ncbi:5-guanidino-2-oxopentanoate decarboxylase [Xinfangfangia pollutisoli]|uniref:5-guanidino-2-oxopentanoate decarboxylase n=1 Tax=Xinfangfangia pollutisoli TaxID=2865960 RepID=UPI001CD3DD82|nr:5-guanidino-2-oxopentanoate decarboxylase [Xinfangfangia pollutisoli]
MANLAQRLVEILAANGVQVVFGIPGVHTVELYRALDGAPIRHVTPRHEQGAGFMADGYARASGKPGVCFVITGPGMTNIATAMGQAYGDSIPMLVISTVNSAGQIGSGRGHLHEMRDQRAMAATVSAFSHTILDPAELEPVLARAFAVFASARPRPVHVEIPVALLRADCGALPPPRPFALPQPPAPRPEAIAEAAAILGAARRPLIIAGGGARQAAGLQALAHRLGAPVHMTVNGRGLLPADDPLALPVTGDFPGIPALIREADAILALGTELGPTDFADCLPGRAEVAAKLIRVDLDPEGLMRGWLPDLALLADAGLVVQALRAALPGPDAVPGWGTERAAQIRAGARAAMPPVLAAGLAVLEDLARAWPEAILAGDSCQPVYAGCTAFGGLAPGGWFCSATGYGTLGYALPAAIGAAIACPDRPVFGLIGDGGLQFTLAELGSAVEVGCAIRLILWNNSGYLEIKRYMQQAGIPPLGVDIFTPDFAAIAAGFGWQHSRIGSRAALQAALAGPPKGNEVIEIDEAELLAAPGP